MIDRMMNFMKMKFINFIKKMLMIKNQHTIIIVFLNY